MSVRPSKTTAQSLFRAIDPVVERLEARQLMCTNPHALESHAVTAMSSGEHVAIALNAGGGAYTDADGQLWSGDFGFGGGAASAGLFEVRDTGDDQLYSNHRSGTDFAYDLPIEPGKYMVRLHFAEPVRGQAQQRVFDVFAEGDQVISEMDLPTAHGLRSAAVRETVLDVTDGTLNLRFQASAGNALVSGVELIYIGDLPVDPPPGAGAPTDPTPTDPTPPVEPPVDPVPVDPAPLAPTGLVVTSMTTTSVKLDWADASTNETSFLIERRVVGTDAFAQIASVGSNVTTYTDGGLASDTTYEYRVRASNATGPSGYTEVVLGTPKSEALVTQIEWTNRNSPSPITRSESLKGVVDGKLYVFGGFSGSAGPVVRSDVYDPATNGWTRIADLPARITHVGVATAGRDIYFASAYTGTKATGYDQTFATRNVWKYNVDTNTFSTVTPLPLARGSGALVYVKETNALHYFGGVDSSRKDRGEHWEMKLDGSNVWVERAANPDPRSHMGYAALNGKVYAIGGQHDTDATLVTRTTTEAYDPATDTWTALAALPRGVSHIGSSTFAMGGRIIAIGGEYAHLKGVADVLAYDPKSDTWTKLTSLPASNNSTVADVIDGYIYNVTGGRRDMFVGKPIN